MEKQAKAPQVLVVSTGPVASIKFGFWGFTGAMGAFGLLVTTDQLLSWAWPLLRAGLGL